MFNWFDLDNNGSLTQNEWIELFDTAPQCPFTESLCKHAAEKNGLSVDGILSTWSLMALLNPTFSVKNLLYIGRGGEPTPAICVTRKSSSKNCQLQQQPGRNVFQCCVFGQKKSGKSILLDSFLKSSKNHDNTYAPTSDDRFDKLLPNTKKDNLAASDVAIFVYDGSDMSLKNGATNLRKKVAQHCKDSGVEVPFRYVADKNCSVSFVVQQISQATLLPISTELGDLNEVFHEIAKAGGYLNTARKSAFCSLRVDLREDSRVGLQEIIEASTGLENPFWNLDILQQQWWILLSVSPNTWTVDSGSEPGDPNSVYC
ncbi:hypothetical protein FEM48_Zijuj07G0086100 [Ziziphus jujuba var. spinosa]|uniref:EF-hand domain-containing protein n=1 Tax=Ziziphus jujuba var. spinosa TaxID=714518 RepID=A0A978V3L4_ZIZJJ|nr:hypothetical protein FEM48_Zijuj07G0086100 [Ziziphus jujuba var. spinosa]